MTSKGQSMNTTQKNQTLRIGASGLRRRIRNRPDDMDDDRKEVIYIQKEPPISLCPNIMCIVYIVLWFACLITGLFYLQHTMCNISEGLAKVQCKSPDYIYSPVLMDHVHSNLKKNRRVQSKTRVALHAAQFDQTANWKRYLYSDLNIHISAIVYSNQYGARIGEIAFPLTALYYENCIDEMVIIDDTEHHKSSQLWEQQILFDDKLPSEQLRINDIESRYYEWDALHTIKRNNKQFLRTSNIGTWKGFERGSRLGYVPKTAQRKTRDKKNIELLLFLDTYHQLPFNDEWITNALGLFEEYPNLQVLGGFSGVIKEGKTFGDVNVMDMRTQKMDNEANVFVMSRHSDYYKQMGNKRKYDESRVNIVELMDKYKEQYFDVYWESFWQKAKEYMNTNEFDDDDDEGDGAVGLFSMNFLDDFDKAVFLNEDDDDYDENKVQTGYEGIQFIIKKRFLKKYESEIEKRLPIPAKILKKIDAKRKECVKILKEGYPTEKERKECDVVMKPGGQTVVDYYFIPYEQRIRGWNMDRMEQEIRWIPFMFITSIRMGPIFIRRDWWFDKLLPHLTELEDIMGNILDEDWLDIEISLYTWSLGGYVGLYDAEGFRFDRHNFENGLNRNKKSDAKWDEFENEHHLVKQNKDWNVWNVSHLIGLNEKDNKEKLRLRTSVGDTSSNPVHPKAIDNSRQIMLTLKAFEEFTNVHQNEKSELLKQNMMRLENVPEINPLN